MMIIDFHTHIYPDKIASKAVSSVGEFYNISMTEDGTAESLLARNKECGIDACVVHGVAITADKVQSINDYVASECEKYKELFGFGTIHVDFEDKISEAERIKSLNLKGVKIHPDTQKFDIDDKRMFGLYDYLAQNKLPLMIHCGDYRYDYSHPRRLKRILKEFPSLTAIGAHFGGWSVFDLAYEYLKDTDCYLDTSSSFMMLGMQRARELIRLYGPERMLFGTDFPMWEAKSELEKFYSMELTDEENHLILHKNAERVLKIDS